MGRTKLLLARIGLAMMAMGLVVPSVVWLVSRDFLLSAALALLSQAGAMGLGLAGWQFPSGKVSALASGAFFVLLALFVGVVLFLSESARRGAPL